MSQVELLDEHKPGITCPDYNNTVKPCYHFISDGFCSMKNRFRCIEWLKRNSMLSYSSISKYNKCKRCFYYYYIEGLELKDKPLTPFLGGLVHNYLSVYHSNNEDTKSKYSDIIENKLRELYLKYIDVDNPEPYIVSNIISATTIGIFYCDINKNLEQGDVEYEIVNKDIGLKGIIDLYSNDKIYDWKYTGSPSSYSRLSTELQAIIYFMLLPDVRQFTLRLIRKPSLKIAKNENVEEFSERLLNDIKRRPAHYIENITFWRSEYNIPEKKGEIDIICNEIKSKVRNGSLENFYKEYTCHYLSVCDYYSICNSGVISEDEYTRRETKK